MKIIAEIGTNHEGDLELTCEMIRKFSKTGANIYKVASGNATHRPIIDKLIEINKPIILSLGFLEENEIYELVEYFKQKNFNKFSLLHCHVEYPTPINKSNLKNITILKEMFPDMKIGYSDHTTSTLIPAIAVSLEAEIIEKHVYLKKVILEWIMKQLLV